MSSLFHFAWFGPFNASSPDIVIKEPMCEKSSPRHNFRSRVTAQNQSEALQQKTMSVYVSFATLSLYDAALT